MSEVQEILKNMKTTKSSNSSNKTHRRFLVSRKFSLKRFNGLLFYFLKATKLFSKNDSKDIIIRKR